MLLYEDINRCKRKFIKNLLNAADLWEAFSLELINGKMSHRFKAQQQQKFIINSYAGFFQYKFEQHVTTIYFLFTLF